MRLTPEQWSEAQRICTKAQLDALELWRNHAGYKRIALVLHIHPSTAKARIEDGLRKLGLSLNHFAT